MMTKLLKKCLTILALMQICKAMILPDYISACSRSDPKLDECMVNNGNKAFPFLLKGDEKFNMPNLLPLKVPQINIETQSNLRMEFKNCELHGLETTVLKNMHADFDKLTTLIEVKIDKLQVLAEYDINGRILILPVQGNGPSNITIAGGTYKYDFTFELKKRKNGKEFVKFLSNNLEFQAERIYLRLDNLFNGDKTLGDNMNKFLDENWKDVTDELYPSLKVAVGSIVTSIATGVFSKIPFESLFLP